MPDIKQIVPDEVTQEHLPAKLATVFEWFKSAQDAGVDPYGLAIFAGFVKLLHDGGLGSVKYVTLVELDELLDWELAILVPRSNTIKFILAPPEGDSND